MVARLRRAGEPISRQACASGSARSTTRDDATAWLWVTRPPSRRWSPPSSMPIQARDAGEVDQHLDAGPDTAIELDEEVGPAGDGTSRRPMIGRGGRAPPPAMAGVSCRRTRWPRRCRSCTARSAPSWHPVVDRPARGRRRPAGPRPPPSRRTSSTTSMPRRRQPARPVGRLVALVEAHRPGVLVPRAAHETADAGPGHGTEAHGARLARGDQLDRPRRAEGVGAQPGTGEGDGDDLGVGDGRPAGEDQVDADRHQVDRRRRPKRRPRRGHRSALDVAAGQVEHQPHAGVVVGQRADRPSSSASHPARQRPGTPPSGGPSRSSTARFTPRQSCRVLLLDETYRPGHARGDGCSRRRAQHRAACTDLRADHARLAGRLEELAADRRHRRRRAAAGWP